MLLIANEPVVCRGSGARLADLPLDLVAVSEPRRAEKLLDMADFDVLVVDLSRPGTGRLDLLRHARRVAPGAGIILVSGASYHHEIADAFALGAVDYLPKPVAAADLVRSISRALADDEPQGGPQPLEELALELGSAGKRAALKGMQALVSAVEARDPDTRRHGTQVARYARHLARRLDLEADLVAALAVAALIHDVGKIGIPDAILTTPGELTPEQFECVRRHPGLGEYIIRNVPVFEAEARIVRHHHENWDGSGYPDGLSGEEISLASRVIRIADAIDAMLMRRSYRTAYPVEYMLDELRRCGGREFDPKLAAVAVEWCRLHPRELALAASDRHPAPVESR